MQQMMLLKSVRRFFMTNPGYQADLVELSAIIYILSCKMIGVKPVGCLIPKPRRCVSTRRTTNE